MASLVGTRGNGVTIQDEVFSASELTGGRSEAKSECEETGLGVCPRPHALLPAGPQPEDLPGSTVSGPLQLGCEHSPRRL